MSETPCNNYDCKIPTMLQLGFYKANQAPRSIYLHCRFQTTAQNCKYCETIHLKVMLKFSFLTCIVMIEKLFVLNLQHKYKRKIPKTVTKILCGTLSPYRAISPVGLLDTCYTYTSYRLQLPAVSFALSVST